MGLATCIARVVDLMWMLQASRRVATLRSIDMAAGRSGMDGWAVIEVAYVEGGSRLRSNLDPSVQGLVPCSVEDDCRPSSLEEVASLPGGTSVGEAGVGMRS